MCTELNALKDAIAEYAGGFDAASLLPSEADLVARVCARMEASIATVKALAITRSAEAEIWRHAGYRSASDQLATETGIAPGVARRIVDTGRRLASQPEVAQAALAGQLSADQAAAVSDGVAADPSKTGHLLEQARNGSLGELNEEVARVKAAVTDMEARRREIHAKRSLRRWADRDGAFHTRQYGNVEHGAWMWQALDPIRRRLIITRRGVTPNERFEALDYDALVTLVAVALGRESELSLSDLREVGLFPQLDGTAGPAQTASTVVQPELLEPPAVPDASPGKKLGGSPARIMIRVDFDTLLRGVALDGELCEMDGYGPVPVSLIQELMANGNTFLVGLLTKGQEIMGVYHHGRRPNAHQRSALDFLYPSCAVKGCNAKVGLQSDHREDWAKTRYTVCDLLDRLCVHHHRLKTIKGWALVDGRGKRDFVPPTDPRHPSRSGPAP